MCLAIYKPAGRDIPIDNLRSGWIHNSDGGGFAYLHKGKIKIVKGFTILAEFMRSYEEHTKKYPKSPFLVHFRIRSQGDRSTENTHPFRFKHGAMIHNGTIMGTGATWNNGKSDTALFLDKFGDKLSKEIVKGNLAKLDTAMDSNRLVFLFDDGDHAIVNERLGNWTEGVWYSNYSWRSNLAGCNVYGMDE